MQAILTPEQEIALQEYANVYPLRKSKVDRARELVNEILAKRDELARVLGLDEIDLTMHVHSVEGNKNRAEAGHILTEAVEMEKHTECLREKICQLNYGSVIIKDNKKALDIYVYAAHI